MTLEDSLTSGKTSRRGTFFSSSKIDGVLHFERFAAPKMPKEWIALKMKTAFWDFQHFDAHDRFCSVHLTDFVHPACSKTMRHAFASAHFTRLKGKKWYIRILRILSKRDPSSMVVTFEIPNSSKLFGSASLNLINSSNTWWDWQIPFSHNLATRKTMIVFQRRFKSLGKISHRMWCVHKHGFVGTTTAWIFWGLLRSKDHVFTKLTNGGISMSKHPWSIRSWEAAFSSQTEAGFQAGNTELGWKHPLNKNWLESHHFFCLVKRYLLWDKKSHLPIMILTTLGGCKWASRQTVCTPV